MRHYVTLRAASGKLLLLVLWCAGVSGFVVPASSPGQPSAPLRVDASTRVRPSRVRIGHKATVSGKLTSVAGAVAGAEVELQEAPHTHGRFVDVAHTATRADGSYRFSVRPRNTTRYRVRPMGVSGTFSRTVTLTVVIPIPEFPTSRGVIAAAHYLAARAGEKAFAVYDNKHKIAGVNIHARFHSASVVKSMLLVAYLQQLASERRGLDGANEGLMYPMIHSSDNSAASAIFAIVGEGGLARVAREAHMTDYGSGEGWWGFTEISAADMARFFYIQDTLIPRRFDGYARWLLSNIEPSESWGIPAIARPEFQVFFKGGWLPQSEGLVNQAARLERGSETFAMAVLTRDDPSMGYGEETLAGVTARLIGR
ncbi:MAG TPA: hypothetical protein VIG42_00510 [Solirubrobacteraceae bacterium]